MRFAPVALMAGVATATSTLYSTDYVTITSCGPEVTNCPASSTATYSSVYAVPTTSCTGVKTTSTAAVPPPAITSATKPASSQPPAGQTYPAVPPASQSTQAVPPPAVTSSATKPVQPPVAQTTPVQPVQPPVYPTNGVSTSVLTYTSCVPVTSYSTIIVTPSKPVGGVASSTGGIIPTGGVHSAPPTYPTIPPTAGAGKAAGSVVLAAAGVVAAMLA